MQAIPLPPRWPAIHIFTVDVEDYFQVNAFEGVVDRADWDRFPTRVEQNTDRLLELLGRHNAHGTFFTLGWVAQHHPQVVRRIVDAGHEVASHGYWHRKVTTLSPDVFRQDIRESKQRIEDVSGQPCLGFRAPSFSIRPGMEWAFEILAEEGYRYDSSIFPISRPDYGYPKAPPCPVVLHTPAGELLELPMATKLVAGFRLPAAGGGYLRQLPFRLTIDAFAQWGELGVSAVLYTHPWEIDPEQPRINAGLITRLRHYRNLHRTLPRLQQLLARFKFTSVSARYAETLHPAPQSAISEPTQPAA
ncbi:MAG TPA: XrtA system polysaccharide deacetylase [Gemmatimonadales bacterium]|nr:XrtA system polysaccharide deacetylase [Gemmatimonadales bacterium]